jgi:hypothetical protein
MPQALFLTHPELTKPQTAQQADPGHTHCPLAMRTRLPRSMGRGRMSTKACVREVAPTRTNGVSLSPPFDRRTLPQVVVKGTRQSPTRLAVFGKNFGFGPNCPWAGPESEPRRVKIDKLGFKVNLSNARFGRPKVHQSARQPGQPAVRLAVKRPAESANEARVSGA